MKTSPAFQFYPADFLTGTAFMSAEEVGGYIRLLCYQWQQGALPDNHPKLATVAGVPVRKLSSILEKFARCEDGFLRNPRMEAVRSDLEEFRVKGAKGGKNSAANRAGDAAWGKQMAAKRQRSHNEAEHEAATKPDTKPDTKPTTNTHTQSHTQSQSSSEPPNPQQPPASPSSGEEVLQLHGEPPPQPPPFQPTPEQSAVNRLFNRRDSTPWSDKEIKAWKAIRLGDGDLELLASYYTADIPKVRDFRRRDLLTLLNNWNGELDRARKLKPATADDRAF